MSTLVTAVLTRMAEVLRRPLDSINYDSELAVIAPDSFVLVEMVIELQDEFGVRFDHADMSNLRTVRDVIALVERRLAV